MATTASRLDAGAPACVKCGNGGFRYRYIASQDNVQNPGVQAMELTCNTCGFTEQRAPLDEPKAASAPALG